MPSSKYIAWFKNLNIKDIPTVGGKNASLGEMYAKLTKKGIVVPNGFAITADAYRAHMVEGGLEGTIKKMLSGLNARNVRDLAITGEKIRRMILAADLPWEVVREIKTAYKELSKSTGKKQLAVAVRSSATAEDLPTASFAGQQETYLNVRGEKELLIAVKKCLASLFTDRAISYRVDKGFDHTGVALSVAVQEMVRSDIGAAGVMFTLDTESGHKGVVLINAAYGLGEYVVKGRVVPDQFYVFKDGVKRGLKSIISRRLGTKQVKLVYARNGGTSQEPVKISDQNVFCVNDKDVITLAKWGMIIEEHYGHAMDIEWAKDGETGKMYIVQARSETVKSQEQVNIIETYHLEKKSQVLVEGVSVGQKIGAGKVRIIDSPAKLKNFKKGEVLVTRLTDPDWEPIMRLASAIVTEQGGKTSHAAIVSRELGTPCVVGAVNARKLLKNSEHVTVSCAEGDAGYVYKGTLPFSVKRTELKELRKTKTKIMMNVGDPNSAFSLAAIPNDGVGLAREEFIFTDFIKIHPLALTHFDELKDKKVKEKINKMTVGYENKADFCVDRLAEGVAIIAAAFFPRDVVVRLSDFKTNEYATLLGGTDFEPKEENPMIGWRGASRYYDPKYKDGFHLECKALKKVRENWGLKNVIIMVPFCRTPEEGKKVIATMKEFGLERGKNDLKVYVMCEIPSNVILADDFAQVFDGFSIGSNDLTQLTLGVDRDSALVSHIYDENNAAVKKLIRSVIKTAHKRGRKVGICGQAPSDYPKFAEFLVEAGIDSISLNPDTVLKTRQNILTMEKRIRSSLSGATAISKTIIIMAIGLMAAMVGLAL
jgi:pyruvate,water dikinase